MIGIYLPQYTRITSQEFELKLQDIERRVVRSCDTDSIDLLVRISAALLKSPLARSAPQVTVAGYWLRRAAIESLIGNWKARLPSSTVPAPRGLAFHLPPTNVDTLFVYSWALSVLAGNSNVVRLPSELNMVAGELVKIIATCVCEKGMQDRHLFVDFDHRGPQVEMISKLSSVRMIWGGDEKVNAVSRHRVKPSGISLGFPDRFSFCAIKTSSYLVMSQQDRTKLAQNFFNDTYWFDQLGCGSPRILYWIGLEEDANEARPLFFDALDQAIKIKSYEVATGVAIEKMTYVSRLAAQGDISHAASLSNELMVLSPTNTLNLHGDVQGGGVLATLVLPSLENIGPQLKAKDQTMSYYGFSQAELLKFASESTLNGLCRIVPIGEALSFEPIWDGMDLLASMSRLVTVRLN